MDNYLNVLLRSIIEAITEFLPVSSTGHLFFFTSYFPFQEIGGDSEKFDDLFDIFIQTGAILSVIVLYFQQLLSKVSLSLAYLTKKTEDSSGYRFMTSIVLGSLPILCVGFLAKDFLDVIKSRPDLHMILGASWLLGGVAIVYTERRFAASHTPTLEQQTVEEEKSILVVPAKSALWVGLLQCIALVPGVSRSAATIITARYLGFSKKDAAEYSFFLAIPVLIAAGLYKLYKYRDILFGEKLILLFLGFTLSFVFCLAIIKWFLAFVKKYSFSAFGYYRILLGSTVLLVFFLR
ncbi:MAG: undecaprenyl-diphosphate phosphatase [Spirochaetota bacterium]